jgi:hypothetical protein
VRRKCKCEHGRPGPIQTEFVGENRLAFLKIHSTRKWPTHSSSPDDKQVHFAYELQLEMGFIIYTESHGWEKSGRCKQGCLRLTQKNLHNLHSLHGVVPEPNPEKHREHYAEATADLPNLHSVFTSPHALGALSPMAAGNVRASAFDRLWPQARLRRSREAWHCLRG